ncbi:MAG: LacI family DNA-binding transcriptional regulator [Treponema sp.]|jgi:LacI family transcriptional regulator|nr:LacI family DNA-binding transcriptional regulator [Treponema sp.]
MVTSKKIAEMAGVSRGTVDRALNNRGDINPATKKKILEIATLLRYKPGRAGRILVNHQKKLKIGCIIMGNPRNLFIDDLYEGIMMKVEEYSSYGIEILVEKIRFQGEIQCKYIDKLLKLGIKALMIQPVNEEIVARKLQTLSEKGIPVVTVDTDINGFTPLCHIGNDAITAGKTAANLLDLITGGKCNVGVVTSFHTAHSHSDRIEGFKTYLKDQKGMKIVSIVENFDNEAISYNVTCDMLKEHPEINGLFLVAGGVYGAGKAIKTFPFCRHFKVISFDDVPSTRALILDGTIQATICQQPIRQGILSLDVLFEYLLDGKRPVETRIYTDIQIKVKTNINFLTVPAIGRYA